MIVIIIIIITVMDFVTEEILGSHVANWWSDDGRLLCYGMFNDSDVPMFKFQYYGPKTDVYGRIIEIAYPKVGTEWPILAIVLSIAYV